MGMAVEVARSHRDAFAVTKEFFVTQLYDFADHYYRCRYENGLFLRAVREDEGKHIFKIVDGEPLQTSYGNDLYKLIFTVV